jgi:hypothetical protein
MNTPRLRGAGHVAGLSAVLLVVAAIVGTDSSFSSDEGAAIIQGRLLGEGSGWLLPNAFPRIDPTGVQSFVALSEHGTLGTAPFAKHFTYPLLLSLAHRIGGVTAMVVVSIVAAVLAAWVTARIARRLDPRLEWWAFWAAGVGSPLLFDSQLVIAHTIGAALVGAAVLVVLRLREAWSTVLALAVCLALFVASLQRNEAILFAGVLALVLIWVGVSQRQSRWFALAAGCVVAGVAAAVVDRFALGRIVGSPVSVVVPLSQDGFLVGRVGGFVSMTILPGSSWPPLGRAGILLMFLAVVAGGVAARSSDYRPVLVRVASGLAVLGAVLPLFGRSPDTVPSLLLACPLVLAGVIVATRRMLVDEPARLLTVLALSFVAAVAATQYNQAGAAEWGARFLAIALPIIVPLALYSLITLADRLPRDDVRVATSALVVVSLAMGIIAVWNLRYFHDNSSAYVRVLDDAADGWVATGDAGLVDGQPSPVVVTTWIGTGRLYWPSDLGVRGMTVETDQLAATLASLRAEGIDRVSLFSVDAETDLAHLGDGWEAVASFPEGRSRPGPAVRLQSR